MNEQEFWKILMDVPPPQPVFFRLYYNQDGSPLHYTMEDLPGNWVEIDRETYVAADPWVKVVDGKIKKLNRLSVQKLVLSNQGTSCHPNNVAVIDASSNTTWSKQIYGFED
jgi:hypothetical protein